ncbi:MAG TPA: hypothetical protein VEY30_06465 [Myxococcaceae bacterium]|nr:hypothetical protein [Myxococcaceae bacterium]
MKAADKPPAVLDELIADPWARKVEPITAKRNELVEPASVGTFAWGITLLSR